MQVIVVPEQFANRRVQVSGEIGARWVRDLPSVVDGLCRRWNLTVEGRPMAGEVGLAIPVRRDEEALILKASFPDPDSEFEAWALEIWNGDGAALLIDHENQWNILLERLDSGRSLRSLPIDKAVQVAAQLLRRLAVNSPAGPPLQTETIKHIETELIAERRNSARLVPADVIDLALDCADVEPVEDAVLVNTDLHYDNVLAGIREPWLAIDPKVVIGQVEFGIAPLIWNLRDEFSHTSPAQFLDLVVKAGNFDANLARRFTVLRTVDYWMWAIETGLTEDPRMCRAVVDALR